MDVAVVRDVLQCRLDLLICWKLIDLVSFSIVVVLSPSAIEGTTMDVDIVSMEKSLRCTARFGN